MLRIIHTADVHLGARHDDLGEQAAPSASASSPPSSPTIDLAIAEKVDLVLIAGDLFDSNVQPRRSVERVAAQLKRLADAKIRTVIIPGTHDVYDRSSIYRAYDLKALGRQHAGRRPGDGPDAGHAGHPPAAPATSSSTARSSPRSARRTARCATCDVARAGSRPPTWHVGLVHGAVAIPGKTDRDDVVITTDEIAASGLDYLALGHWHSAQQAKAGGVTYAYAGAPEPVALDQDRAGKVLLSSSRRPAGADGHGRGAPGRQDPVREARPRRRGRHDPAGLHRRASPRRPTRTSCSMSGSSASGRTSSTSTPTRSRRRSPPSFLKVRVRDVSAAGPDRGRAALRRTRSPAPSSATSRRASPSSRRRRADDGDRDDPAAEAAELRDALRLGRLLLAGHEVSL